MPKTKHAPEKLVCWRVKCSRPDVQTWEVTVTAPEALLAGVKAAEIWGVPWAKVAAYLDTVYAGEGYRRKCSSCGKEYYTSSAAERYGRCESCKAELERRKNQFAARERARKKAER